nr:unnamed protein product [Callosobruchus analis]
MIYSRGNRLDYDLWEAMGNPGWSYKDVLPYFLKSEGASIAVNDSGYHNKDGPLGVSDLPYRTKSATVFLEAAQEAGYPYVDYNGKHEIGTSYAQTTMRNGLRSNAEISFLRPVRHRKNLTIRREAHVTKILIEPATKQAYGVEYVKNNIPLIKNLPVGESFYDHVGFTGMGFLVNETISCERYSFDSDQYWECAIRTIPTSIYHPMGTCRMGPEKDKEAVVDSHLRVYGIKSLRVADMSVAPRTVSGHTVAPAYMIGEKGADIIKKDWGMLTI